MDKRSQNKFNMFKVVRQWCLEHEDKFTALPGYTETFTQFSTTIDEIATLDLAKTTVIKGVTITKGEARTSLEEGMMQMSRIMKVYATFNNNQVLLNEIDFTASQLRRSSEQLLIVRASKMMEHANAIQPTAEALGLTVDRAVALQNAIDTFKEKQTTVRSAIVNRRDAGEQIEAHIDEANDILKGKLDLLMELSQNTYPELYNQYKASREIINR